MADGDSHPSTPPSEAPPPPPPLSPALPPPPPLLSAPISDLWPSLFALVSSSHSCLLRPLQFFVAWQGVLTIAYSGFPPSLCQLKRRIENANLRIIKENPGSMWPKTTLACLKDNERLTSVQLLQLWHVCSEETAALIESPSVSVEDLSLVVYENCSLEKTFIARKIPLLLPVDGSEPGSDQTLYVHGVLEPFKPDHLEDYYFCASKEGNRSTHYRCSRTGFTLVHFLMHIPNVVRSFKSKVEACVPGMYDWFAEESLHITIRALLDNLLV